MININDLKHIDEYIYEIPATYREDMRVPARFYSDSKLLEGILGCWKAS
jgi:tRNA-splicing ligase RtcB